MLRRLYVFAALVLATVTFAQERIQDVIYLKEGGAAFTMDVFKPKTPNGAAVVYMVSGGWVSNHDMINKELAGVLNNAGYTVFEVVHGSQPLYKIPMIEHQITRAMRFIHANASKYGVDDKRLAITGISSGGHLSLITAAMGDEGNPDAKDPIDKFPSSVKTVAVFMPPTDFLNWGKVGAEPSTSTDMDPFRPAFGAPDNATPAQITEIFKLVSPINYLTPKFPPCLLIHGSDDPLVPVQQSEIFRDAVVKLGGTCELLVVKGGKHDGVTVAGGLLKYMAWLNDHLK
ncbi:hypothetical protein BH11ARM1_BH11ARM1_11160 [soil metagenome]